MHIMVMGAGAAGLCAAKNALQMMEHHGEEPMRLSVIEQSAQLGGIWSCANDGLSPVYENLHTNLPKELMAFPGFPFQACEKSFVHHSEVKSYLESYAQHYHLHKHIRFGRKVARVTPQTPGDAQTGWIVELENTETGQTETEVADLLLICTGVRDHQPRLPEISKKFSGDQLHSSQFKSAADGRFEGKTVLLMGGGPSGMDIATEIGRVAERVIISMGRGVISFVNMAHNIEKAGHIISIDEDQVVFEEHSQAVHVDTIVWCTGYEKSMPYLAPDCGLSILEDGYVVDPLFMHVINLNYPTMAVLHINTGNVPFPAMDMQARFFLTLIKENMVPSQQKMRDWLEQDQEWRRRLGMLPKHRHKVMGEKLLHWGKYMNQLAKQAKLEPLPRVLDDMLTFTIMLVAFEGFEQARQVQFELKDNCSFKVSARFMKVNLAYYALPVFRLLGLIH